MEWLLDNSVRPQAATTLLAKLFTALHRDTGEIMLTRTEIAEGVGIAPRHVSTIMTELEGIGAISRRRAGRDVRYFLNPWIATYLTGKARDDAQAAAPQLKLEPAAMKGTHDG
ncbi:MAG: helix-turn-helix domain-containing protein [Chloroflexota bacterium]|nr:helix-turn-helix domain-containing protein [Chloroflexota bacterium]